MRRTHARLLVRRTRDPEWIALSPLASWLYGELLLTPEITSVGTLTLLPRQWAKRNVGTNVITMTEEIVWSLVEELTDSRHILVDYDTDEVMIRTFLRNDGLATNYTALLSVCSAVDVVRSPRLREALATELERVLRELPPPPAGTKRPKLYPSVVGALQEAIKHLTDGNRLPPGPGGGAMGDRMGDAIGDAMGDAIPPQPSLFDGGSDGGSGGGSRNPGVGEGEGVGTYVPVLEMETSTASACPPRAHAHTRARQDHPPDPKGDTTARGVEAHRPVGVIPPEPVTYSHDQPDVDPDRARASTLTHGYLRAEPMALYERVQPVVLRAVQSGRYGHDEIATALGRLARDNRSVTVETLRIELAGQPTARAPTRRSSSAASYLALADADPEPDPEPEPWRSS